MKTHAMFYEKINDKIHCYLCPHNCVIKNGSFGKCSVRRHENGQLFSTNYGEITSIAIDPIEKKPLHYYKPGSYILSIGGFGCNLACDFCQNHIISQSVVQSDYISKEGITDLVLKTKESIGIAFTYNEPSIWYEYVYDCAKLIKKNHPDCSVVIVTNGFINEEPLKKLLPYVDAMNIDLKSYSHRYYEELCGGRLTPVLQTIKLAAASCHIEITTLIVRDKNDSLDEIEEIAKFISGISPDIPLHLSRYFPSFKRRSPATDVSFMYKAKDTAGRHLNRVVLGNI